MFVFRFQLFVDTCTKFVFVLMSLYIKIIFVSMTCRASEDTAKVLGFATVVRVCSPDGNCNETLKKS